MSPNEQELSTVESTVPSVSRIEDHAIVNSVEDLLYVRLYPMREKVALMLTGTGPDLYYLQIQEDLKLAILLAEGERGKNQTNEEVVMQLHLLMKKIEWGVEQSHKIKEQMISGGGASIEGEVFPASGEHFIAGESPNVH